MKKFKFEFEVDDDFEVWGCQACPLGILVNVDTEEYKCQLNEYWHDCPLEEVKEQLYLEQARNLTDEEIKELEKMLELMDQVITLKEMNGRIR